ncbi:Pyrroline-5-carboxylate reductase [Trema orientale]|uniref:Pyrroline-5-carboxylate reductase n=1 Tax=Trema orientale TaxID=63057 RepID=A0A2P5ECC6_TREOI|nr:Pyrroline-5-carboxylate reductase [Trema orientale]
MAKGEALKPIDKDNFNLGFIGAGNLASIVATGLVKLEILLASRMFTVHRNLESMVAFTSLGVQVFQQSSKVVEECDVIIFVVKPQMRSNFGVGPSISEDKLLVSLAVGHKLKVLQEWAGHGRFIRIVPSTASAVGEVAIVDNSFHLAETYHVIMKNDLSMNLGEGATKEDEELIANLFGAVGKVWIMDEKLSDAAGAVGYVSGDLTLDRGICYIL